MEAAVAVADAVGCSLVNVRGDVASSKFAISLTGGVSRVELSVTCGL